MIDTMYPLWHETLIVLTEQGVGLSGFAWSQNSPWTIDKFTCHATAYKIKNGLLTLIWVCVFVKCTLTVIITAVERSRESQINWIWARWLDLYIVSLSLKFGMIWFSNLDAWIYQIVSSGFTRSPSTRYIHWAPGQPHHASISLPKRQSGKWGTTEDHDLDRSTLPFRIHWN